MRVTFSKTFQSETSYSVMAIMIPRRKKDGYCIIDVEDGDREWTGCECEICGMPVFEDEPHKIDSNGVCWHESACYPGDMEKELTTESEGTE